MRRACNKALPKTDGGAFVIFPLWNGLIQTGKKDHADRQRARRRHGSLFPDHSEAARAAELLDGKIFIGTAT
ncbi:MAG TPA: hypothetical protein VLJ11_04435 [Bryobacteraceae bacterium]|nr:hypothetical protein [Bryobacteraceae bacterium]